MVFKNEFTDIYNGCNIGSCIYYTWSIYYNLYLQIINVDR